MMRVFRSVSLQSVLSMALPAFGLLGCSASKPPPPPAVVAAPAPRPVAQVAHPAPPPLSIHTAPGPNIMLGIDMLEAEHFAILKGKRVALLTHPAGVDRNGVSTIDILRRAPGVSLVALFSCEHGIYMEHIGGENYPDHRDPKTGLMVYSLYKGDDKRPTKAELQGIDTLVIDLQDIGTRSYTFVSAMKLALEGCFLNNVEVVVLDRPNPLGGLKVDGPLLDPQWGYHNYAGEFRVPYVHGLTMGELATMAKEAPAVLDIPEAVRQRGRLTVVEMHGWHRWMRWPDTGLRWTPTSPYVNDFQAVEGYPMTGLGRYFGGFEDSLGMQYAFRGISHKGTNIDLLEKELKALHIPGIDFAKVSVPNATTGKPGTGLYIEITDWDAWHPTELNFWMMKLDCELEPVNPFALAAKKDPSGFLRHMGSQAFFNDLVTRGAKVDVAAYLKEWRLKDQIYQEQSKRYWLYH